MPYGPLICRILCNCKPACIAPASANKFAPRRLLCIFGCAMLAAYTVAPRQSSLGCLPAVCLEIYVCLTVHSSAESSAIASLLALHRLPANKFAPLRLLRIFGCALLAAYTVAPRHSSLGCLPASYLEIYGCLAAPADAASLCRCKLVCSASAPDICRFACYISRLCDANFLLYSRLLRIFAHQKCYVMNPEVFIFDKAKEAVEFLYGVNADEKLIQTQATRKEFEGDITLVTFPLLKISKQAPEATASQIGGYLKEHNQEIESFNVVKGFLNIKFSERFWMKIFNDILNDRSFGQFSPTGKTVMVEYSSPNTNKPLHLGHIRNILLGSSVSRLLEANGHKVIKVNLVNDRGIHICKSMLAWKKEGNGETPESSGMKGDHLVGKYYVAFSNELKRETAQIAQEENIPAEEAEKKAPALNEAREMLVKWEQGDKETVDLWKTMNSWVYDGFDITYRRLGISFDRTYYESQTYLLGKSLVQKGLEAGIFERHEDGSVWCNLENDGLDRKLLLRGDGTSVYITQDLGTANQRFEEYRLDKHIYVVGNEQNYHFQVLKLILKKLGFAWADSIYHLSYGMVELPEGKMKSREGTVVDADDLMDRMFNTAKETSLELGKLSGMNEDEQNGLFEMIGLGALKYFIIKVDPKKTMLFDPKESIDFNGNTGPFIQYTHARIKSILRRAASEGAVSKAMDPESLPEGALLPKEVEILKLLNNYPTVVKEAGDAFSPAMIANYIYDLAKEFNQYYHDTSILKEPDASLKANRLALLELIASVLVKASTILGIGLPERM